MADVNFLNISNKYKNKLPQWAIGKGNFGCAQVTIEDITKNEYFAHSAIQAEIESVKGTWISIKLDSTLLKAIKVDGNNVVGGAGAWLRDVDTEFKILSEIQNQLGTKYNTVDKIKFFTELECCPSCLDVIKQFFKLYPNIDIEIIYKIKKIERRLYLMNKYNFYESKFRTLESFYMWVEQGSTYDVAASQCMYYDQPQNELDEIVMSITIGTRFARCGKALGDDFKQVLKKKIESFNMLDLSKYNLNEEELKVFKEEISEVSGYISN
ncbi:deaminase domain-containing protein [Hathewaya histolytica]|uniref:RHS repeat-associated core domain-containing protein n=1 Tax=Hathewaya histolytica TaxID=1498 RepID=A0A4U9R168_HATHI|nr:deaminase domain-containing protein [Hathewaya histolytica]VTQ84228.1 RHS repeat-associated core domain-containing protein [Hathewaya histolytica]